MAKAGLKLEARPQPSKAWGYGSPVLALLVTVLIGIVLFMALGQRPCAGSAGVLLGAHQKRLRPG